MKALKLVGKVLGAAACAGGMAWFLLPLLRGGFRLGAVFGLCVCTLGLCLVLFYRRAAAGGGWRKALARGAVCCYLLGLCWAGFLTGLMISAQNKVPPENANVVVLGAQVYSAERMGVSLAGRVEKAGEYLLSHPRAKVIVTGGQGADEPCPESLTQRNALVAQGVEEDRIFQEDRSHNTRQNLEYAMDIAQEEGLGTEFVVVTQEFHMFRALQLAETAGFTAYSLTAQSDPLLLPEYYGRELLSLTKWMVERQFLG